jgi:hypothetical protein
MDDGGWWTRRRRRTGVGRSRSLAHLAACPSAWTEMVNDRFLVPPQTQIRRRRRWMIGWRLACGLWGRFGLGLDWQWQWPGARPTTHCDMKWYFCDCDANRESLTIRLPIFLLFPFTFLRRPRSWLVTIALACSPIALNSRASTTYIRPKKINEEKFNQNYKISTAYEVFNLYHQNCHLI